MAPADIVSLAESILGVAGWVAFSPIGAVAESQQEQEDAQEGSGRDHLGAAWVAVRGAEAVQGLLRGLRWASGCGPRRGHGRPAGRKPGLHRGARC